MGKYYITTAIAYTSRKPHIGNTYEIVLTDAIARYRRLIGDDVFFLTGTDEHGQKIQELAENSGVTPKEYVDGIAGEVRAIWDLMNTSYDKFIRTTDDYHEKTVQEIFKKLYDQGDIYKGKYEGLYCVPCESFFTETQAENGICPDCGRPVTKTVEEAYFFKMSKYQDKLMKHIEENPDFIKPESRKKEMVNNFLKPGLQYLFLLTTSTLFMYGLTLCQTTLLLLATLPTKKVSCMKNTGLQMSTLSVKTFFVSTQFTGQFFLWLWENHCPNRYLVIPGCFSARTK